MKTFLKFASIPLVLFVVFFGLPRLISSLFNSHTDSGLLAILILACGICGVFCNKVYGLYMKEVNNDEA